MTKKCAIIHIGMPKHPAKSSFDSIQDAEAMQAALRAITGQEILIHELRTANEQLTTALGAARQETMKARSDMQRMRIEIETLTNIVSAGAGNP